MKLTIDQALQQGIAAHKEGRFEEAEHIYRAILQSHSTHPDANHNLGIIAVSMNRSEAALPLFKIAVEVNPDIEQYWISYIDALIKENQIKNARRVLKRAKNMGLDKDTLYALRQRLMSKAKNQEPSLAELNVLLEHHQNGRYDDAEKLAISITQQFPNHQFSWKVLGLALKYKGRLSEALVATEKALEIDPKDAESHNNLGITLHELCRLEEAEACYRKAMALEPDFTETHYNLGNTLKELGRLEAAATSYRNATALKPNYAEAHNNLGATLQELGKLEDAKASYRNAIEPKPDYADAHLNLSQLKRFKKEDKQFVLMKNLYQDKSLTDEQRCRLGFALGKASEDLNQLGKSFKYYSEGNALRKKLLSYNIYQDIELFNRLKILYPSIEENYLKEFNLSNEPRPIFILGMPRSGTTLVEQIISSHSKVTGAGELPYVEIFGGDTAQDISKLDTKNLLQFRKRYIEKLQLLSNSRLMVTDKAPLNFRYIGLICSAFPDAKIVHVKRNSAATCWGNYEKHFTANGFGYSYNLDDLVAYYRLYKNIMKFWEEPYGDRIYNLNYEILTINQKIETINLIQYIGLDWEDRCLAPQDNKRSVNTASNQQIRQSIYQGSSQKWKKFEPFLNGSFNHIDD